MQTLDDWLSDRREALKATGRKKATSFERAAEALPTYLAALELTDLGPMVGSPLSPNVLHEVRLGDGSVAVLKLIANRSTRRPRRWRLGRPTGCRVHLSSTTVLVLMPQISLICCWGRSRASGCCTQRWPQPRNRSSGCFIRRT